MGLIYRAGQTLGPNPGFNDMVDINSPNVSFLPSVFLSFLSSLLPSSLPSKEIQLIFSSLHEFVFLALNNSYYLWTSMIHMAVPVPRASPVILGTD